MVRGRLGGWESKVSQPPRCASLPRACPVRRRSRQRDFFRGSMLLLALQISHCATFVASYGVALAHVDSCTPPWGAVAALAFVRRAPGGERGRVVRPRRPPHTTLPLPHPLPRIRWTLFSFIMLQLLLQLNNMTVWRGRGAAKSTAQVRAGRRGAAAAPALRERLGLPMATLPRLVTARSRC